MTVTTYKPIVQQPYLYPGAQGGFADICERCFQHTGDLATTSDRRITPTGTLTQTCSACYHALATGRSVELPTGDLLAETWAKLARYAFNEEIERPVIDRALDDLAPGLDREQASEWFVELSGALLWQQDIEAPGYDLLQHEPEERDIDRLRDSAAEAVAEALNALIGGAR